MWYGVYDSPTICHRRESIVSRILGHNRRPMVPGVLDPNSTPKPSVEKVAGADHSMMGRTGTHILL
jgi:hypothetical protein